MLSGVSIAWRLCMPHLILWLLIGEEPMQRRHMLSALAAVSFVPGMSLAQEVKPLRIIVPFPPGGATDITARSLQVSLALILKQPVVLENRGGAGGSIGMAEVARASADGLTLGVATLSTHGVNPAVYSKLPYDPIKDFVGVTEILKAPGVVVVNPAVLPVKDLAELVSYLKANPGKVAYATPGNGTIGHMWGELFKRSAGVSMVHIPYRGAGPAINDVLAGQVGGGAGGNGMERTLDNCRNASLGERSFFIKRM